MLFSYANVGRKSGFSVPRILQHIEHLLMDFTVTGGNFSHINRIRFAVEIRKGSSRFFQNESARSRVPWIQVDFKKTVITAHGEMTKIQRCGAVSPDRLSFLNHRIKKR